MEAKHTAGPWRATLGNSQMSDPGTTIYHRGQWGVYSDADSHGDPEADARLIAAAPELLEACQTFAEWLRREEAGFPAETRFKTPEGEAKWREWFYENLRVCDLAQKQARAAIAKATQ